MAGAETGNDTLAPATVEPVGEERSATLIWKPSSPGASAGGGPHTGSFLTRFHMPRSEFQTADALVSASLSTCTFKRAGHSIMPILLAIHTALGGSMKSRVGQR